ncbi:MAG: hypothetical protein ABEJ75_03985 [Candidatus Nanohaloarchaea archaeon]
MAVSKDELVGAFSESIGEEKATEIVEESAKDVGVGIQNQYEEEDAIQVLEYINDRDDVTSYVRISANSLMTRLR